MTNKLLFLPALISVFISIVSAVVAFYNNDSSLGFMSILATIWAGLYYAEISKTTLYVY